MALQPGERDEQLIGTVADPEAAEVGQESLFDGIPGHGGGIGQKEFGARREAVLAVVYGQLAAYPDHTLDGGRTLAGYLTTSGHGLVRFVISLASNDGDMRFRLLRAIEAGL